MTIRQIAQIAGVSKSTVSLVLNSSPLVSEKTRQKVQEVIRRTRYVPNSNARNLSLRVNNSLGVIVLSDQKRTYDYAFSTSPGLFSYKIIRGISASLADTEYGVGIEYFCQTEERGALPRLIRERTVDGALIVGGYCHEDFIRRMNDSGIPFVIVAVGQPESLCDSVVSDPARGAYLSLAHLYDRGHRNIAFFNCPHSFRSSDARVCGVRQFEEDRGFSLPPDHMVYCEHNNGESAYRAMRDAWDAGLRFTAFVAANPHIALGAMRYLQERGVLIPKDVSVIAYEDNALCGYSVPALTAVNIQKETMGSLAVRALIARINRPDKPIESIYVDQFLVERDSVRALGDDE